MIITIINAFIASNLPHSSIKASLPHKQIVVKTALTLIEKQRQHIGKQNPPICGAVSGRPLQKGSLPN